MEEKAENKTEKKSNQLLDDKKIEILKITSTLSMDEQNELIKMVRNSITEIRMGDIRRLEKEIAKIRETMNKI